MNYLKTPLNTEQFLATANNGRIKVVVGIDLLQLACSSDDGSLDGLNDIVDDLIFPNSMGLLDLNYKLVGTDQNLVLIEVDADASLILNEIS